MTADEPRKKVSKTEDTEYGYYIRKKTRYGKVRRQKTTRVKRNPKKVILGRLGDVEFYTFPHDFPDKVFVGIYPLSDYIEEHQIGDLFRIYNRMRWYFKGEWHKKPKRSNKANVARKTHISAYNAGLDERKERTKRRDLL